MNALLITILILLNAVSIASIRVLAVDFIENKQWRAMEGEDFWFWIVGLICFVGLFVWIVSVPLFCDYLAVQHHLFHF